MAESHELCEYLDSLPKNQELYLNGLDKWVKSNDPLNRKNVSKRTIYKYSTIEGKRAIVKSSTKTVPI